MPKAKAKKKIADVPCLADIADPYRLYELSVQSPEFELEFVEDIFKQLRGRKPKSLREDFCGTAWSACHWVERGTKNISYGVDINSEVLEWAKQHNVPLLKPKARERVSLLQADAMSVKTDPVEVIQAFNFSYWILQERHQLKKYFKNAYRTLQDDGLLFLDAFGGSDAHTVTEEEREIEDYDFTYIWDQASYNPLNNEMQCYIHFEFPDGSRLDKAFSYRWRLWGAKEVRELLAEVGFSNTRLYVQGFEEDSDEPSDEFIETEECEDHPTWLGYIVAEK